MVGHRGLEADHSKSTRRHQHQEAAAPRGRLSNWDQELVLL
jgi:hypothetical protein